ncbi:melanoma inhibitory activity protein 2 isoform X2 [Danio aesculapii]|uniref:melanoma inhibitory activity protein 2 isoform X2 n=1 Tax=Danio aesculapii TaxID=1142201 RepID=UPI0024BFC4DE|nr:melanoma inhibitory activity protein 2 isoform X2 [Danio aesculapii]
MAAVHSFILFQMFFGFFHQGLALISDYKICGDPECERMISRVQAQRDHAAKDCRFLNFKKGDLITVYYKLTGKRNDLWAGSTEKLFGLFPKDAIKVDQLFIDEKREIQVPTQEFDFMCFDENGLVIEPSTEFDDPEDLIQETRENDINEVHDTPTDNTEETEPIQISPQDVSNQNGPETTEKGGSSWIGSAVSGWFGRNEQSNDEPQDESSEESFKSRKIVMDIEESHAEEKENSGTFGWLSGELTNAFGFGNQDLKTDAQENIDTPTDDKQTNSWMSMGRDALGFAQDNSAETEAQKAEENTNMEDQSLINPNQSMDSVENDSDEEENKRVEEQTGWYGGIYNQITNLYGEEQTKHDENVDEISPEERNPEFTTDIENIETKESESSSQSIFSVSGLASVVKLPFQADVVVKTDEEKTGKGEDPGKGDFDEEQSNEDREEEDMLTDVNEQDSVATDTDVFSETQLVSDKTKTMAVTESDSTEQLDGKSNTSEESTNNFNADVIVEEVKQDVQNNEAVNIGKDDFNEKQNTNKDQVEMLIDLNEEDQNPKDILGKTPDKTMAHLKDSIEIDSTKQIKEKSNVSEETADSQILESKSVDNLNEVKNEYNADVLDVKQDIENNEENTAKDVNIGKDENTRKDQNEEIVIDVNEQDLKTTASDVFGENQLLSEETGAFLKDSAESDSSEQLDEQSNKTEETFTDLRILEKKSEDKSEKSADVLEVEKDMRDMQNYEEKSAKDVILGKKDFFEQLNVMEDKMSDADELESISEADLISETHTFDETMTSKDSVSSDGIRELNDSSQDSNIQNEVKLADNSIGGVIQSENYLTDSVDEISQAKLTPNLTDQDNLDITKQQENDYDRFNPERITSADISEQLEVETHDQKSEELNVSYSYTDSLIETLIVTEDVKADVISELNVSDVVLKNDNEKQLDGKDATKHDGLPMDRNDELVMKRKDELVIDKNDGLVMDRTVGLVNDELVMDMNDGLDTGKNDESVMDKNDGLVTDRNDGLIMDRNDGLVTDKNDGLVTDQNDGLVANGNDGLVTDRNDGLVTDRNDGLVANGNDGLVMDRNDGLVTDRNDGLVANGNDGLVMDRNDGLVTNRNDELVTNKNDGLVTDRNDGLIANGNNGLVMDRNNGLVTNRNDGLDTDRNDGLVMDGNDGLVTDRNKGLVLDKKDESLTDKNDPLVMDKNYGLVMDRNYESAMDRNDGLVMDRNESLKDKNDGLVKGRSNGLEIERNYNLATNRNDNVVMDRKEAQLVEALSKDIKFDEEKLPDSEPLDISNENELSTDINSLDEGRDQIDLEPNSSPNPMNDEINNTSESHDGSLEKAGLSIVKDTDSESKYTDEVEIHEEQEEPRTVSEPTENNFYTKEIKEDTQNTNGYTKSTSDEFEVSKNDGHDLDFLENTDNDKIFNPDHHPEDLNGHTVFTETKLTGHFFSEEDPVQDDSTNNNTLDQNQTVEHKEDTANDEDHQTDSEYVRKREKRDTGIIHVQSNDADSNDAVHSQDKQEEQLGRPEIQHKKTFSHSPETSKVYENLHPHLSEANIQDLSDLFGDHKLSWLDSKMENTHTGPDNNDLEELGDFEQLLEYYMKMNTKLGLIQQDNRPGEDNDNNKEYPALQKLLTLLSTLKKKYSAVIADINVERQGISKDECVHEACLDVNKDTVISSKEVENNPVIAEMPDINDLSSPQNEPVSQKKEISSNRAIVKDVQTEEIRKKEDWTSSDIKKTTAQNHVLFSEALVESQNGEGHFYNMAIFAEDTIYKIASIVVTVVSSLPDDIRPGPDLYGLPWEAVFFTGFLGLCILLLFTCRFIQSIKSRLYASKEKQMAHKVAELLDEKCKVLETFSEVKQKFDKLESTLQNNGMSARAAEKDTLEVASQKLEQSNAQMKQEIERLQEELSQQNKARKQQEDQLAELEQILRNLEEEAKERKSQLEQDNTTLKIHEINTERLQKNLLAAKEEHTMLLESKEQLMQEAEGWGERLSELEEEMKMCERSHAGMMEDCANKDDRIKSLTECLLKMRDWDSEDETSIDGSTTIAGAENGDSSDFHQKQKVQKLIEAAKMSADLKSLEEDKNRVFAKLADEIKAKEDLHEGIKQLEEQKELLVSESANYSSESQKLQQKLQIMTEMYQENELKLHRMLTVEEKERLQKEEKLNKAGKKISLAAEELNTYRQRAKDLEDELDRTSQAFKNQISSHEKKAHDNWLAARAADRDLADVKRENAHLRQRLTDAQFRFDILEKDVREGRPLFRGERSPYGPSPLGRPSSETRTFLSPPTLMDGPPRLSPQFIGPGRGHPLPDPGLPYRRPPPGPYPMGPLPPRPPLHPEQYFGDKSDSSFLRNSSSISEHEGRDVPGDMRLPPDPDSRMGPLPPPGPPLMSMPPSMDPRDPHFPHRGPFGPPDFFPPRGPPVLPMGMRGPLPPGMFPRAPVPFPQHMGFLPPRAPSDSFTHGPPPRPSPPGSEQPPDQPPAPHDTI